MLALATLLATSAVSTKSTDGADAIDLRTLDAGSEITLDTGNGRRKALAIPYAVGRPLWGGHVQMKNLRATAVAIASEKGHELAHVSKVKLRKDRDAGTVSTLPCKHGDGFAVNVLVSKATSQVLFWTEGKGACKGAKAAAKAAADKAPVKSGKAGAKADTDKAPKGKRTPTAARTSATEVLGFGAGE